MPTADPRIHHVLKLVQAALARMASAAGHPFPKVSRALVLRLIREALARKRYAKKPAAQTAEPEFPEPHPDLWHNERELVSVWYPKHRREFEDWLSRSESGEYGPLPIAEGVRSLGGVGRSVVGEYRQVHTTLTNLLGHNYANAWQEINAVLSANTSVPVHTPAALGILADWHKAGQPTDLKKIVPIVAAPEYRGATMHSDKPDIRNYKTEYVSKILARLGMSAPDSFDFRTGEISKDAMGKTPNFGAAGIWGTGVPVDRHMIRIGLPGNLTHEQLSRLAAGTQSDYMKDAFDMMQKVASYPKIYLGYKTLISREARGMGITPSELQEAVWTGILAVMAAKDLGATTGRAMYKLLRHEAIKQGWDVHKILFNKKLQDAFEKLGISTRKLRAAQKANEAWRAKNSPQRGPADLGNRAALEDVAALIPPGRGGDSVIPIRDVMEKFQRHPILSDSQQQQSGAVPRSGEVRGLPRSRPR